MVAERSVTLELRVSEGKSAARNGWLPERKTRSLENGMPVIAQPRCPGASPMKRWPEYGCVQSALRYAFKLWRGPGPQYGLETVLDEEVAASADSKDEMRLGFIGPAINA